MGSENVAGTSLRNAISNAMARIMRESSGRGPARTRTFICDRFVFAMLDDVLTPGERTLRAGGRGGLVRRARLRFEEMMSATFTSQIEALTGARVLAYHSQIVFQPDMAVEIFVLDRPPHGGVRSAADAQQRTAIANAVSRITNEHWGKGPTHTRAYIHDDFVFCVLEDVLTTAERTLAAGGETDLVRELRLEIHEIARRELAEQVEVLTGRRVLACHGQIAFDPDIQFAIFVLADDG